MATKPTFQNLNKEGKTLAAERYNREFIDVPYGKYVLGAYYQSDTTLDGVLTGYKVFELLGLTDKTADPDPISADVVYEYIIPPSGGGGGGDDIDTYTNLTPVPVTLGGVTAGMTFNAMLVSTVFDTLLYPFTAPSFLTFTFNQVSPIEVGGAIPAGNKTFTWTTSNSAHIAANTISITDVTASHLLANFLPNTGSRVVNFAAPVTNNTASSHTWQIAGTNTQSGTFSLAHNVDWQWAVYYGESATDPLIDTDILALRVKELKADSSDVYAFIAAASQYKYICYPVLFGLKTSFTDPDTGFDVAMEAAYTVTVTNTFGLTTDYYVHRSTNQLGGTLNILVG